MKKNCVKILYRLFSFLSDRTNGFKPFVKYKFIFGALLIGVATTSCFKPTCYEPVAPTCYAPPAPEDTIPAMCYISVPEANMLTVDLPEFSVDSSADTTPVSREETE